MQGVDLRGTLLKPNMVISGKGCPEQASSPRIAELTLECFLNHVPAAIPGIVFLSGGQSEVEATANLNAINQLGGPWPMRSYMDVADWHDVVASDIAFCSMPPADAGSTMTTAEKQKILDWLRCGFPE